MHIGSPVPQVGGSRTCAYRIWYRNQPCRRFFREHSLRVDFKNAISLSSDCWQRGRTFCVAQPISAPAQSEIERPAPWQMSFELFQSRSAELAVVKRTVRPPLYWPADPQHTYALWFELPTSSASPSRAYVTAHPIYRDIGVHSRFAIKLDLPGTYASKSAAAADGYAAAHRFFHGKYSVLRVEATKTISGYRVIAQARFRIDCHEWEPVLSIRSEHPKNKGAVQTFDGRDSPFVQRTFRSAPAAASYALAYGERLVLGMIRGLHV